VEHWLQLIAVMNEPTTKQYVLVIKDRYLAFGPFSTAEDAEYMAMGYYGTAITGASINNEFLIAELVSGGEIPAREHARHVEALMASDV
jgi:hypothetical protein